MENEPLIERAVSGLENDRERGASELARCALEALAELVERSEDVEVSVLERQARKWASALRLARPTMVPIANLVDRWREQAVARPGETADRFRSRLRETSLGLARESRRAVEAIAVETARLIPGAATVITISRSSTVTAAFRLAASRSVSAIVPESRPGMEGHRLAQDLDRLGIPTQLITDAQMGHFAPRADVALVGVDAVLADGSVVNKAGTLLLALAARQADIPFWVCCESFKRSDVEPPGFPLEEMEAAALGAPKLPHVRPRNVAFDITPPSLVTRWIDEYGSRSGSPRPKRP
jgi:translation initiation factor eIF-2B subunit delta